ncbi:MAG: helix-turn-helix transcriptional regulator [Eggerthellaceae bacterium]|nr:helix-turn-helix transcriptional regulator [Eggerthellaceae bacterium]
MQTLKEARIARGIKQLAVADAIKVTRQTYAKYEENPRLMPVYQAEAACNFIGCDISDIFFGLDVSKTN